MPGIFTRKCCQSLQSEKRSPFLHRVVLPGLHRSPLGIPSVAPELAEIRNNIPNPAQLMAICRVAIYDAIQGMIYFGTFRSHYNSVNISSILRLAFYVYS